MNYFFRNLIMSHYEFHKASNKTDVVFLTSKVGLAPQFRKL